MHGCTPAGSEIDSWPDMPDLPPPGEFGGHTISLRSITAALNARCLHSVSGSLSVCQPVTYVTPIEIGKIKLKFVNELEAFISSKYYKY